MEHPTEDPCNCKTDGITESILSYVTQTDSFFGSTQRGSCSPSREEKWEVAHKILHKSPSTFLTRYGVHLNDSHRRLFRQKYSGDEEILYQLRVLEDELEHKDTLIKNRRFMAMKNLMAGGEYFSDEQMKRRDPLLYDQMIGRYLTDDEVKEQSDAFLQGNDRISSILIQHIESKENERIYQLQSAAEQSQMEESDEDEEDEAEDDGEENESGKPEISTEDREMMRQEFLHVMQERFMSGNDLDFDYRAVDDCTQYDDVRQIDRDAEEKYFDEESDDGGGDGGRDAAAASSDYDY